MPNISSRLLTLEGLVLLPVARLMVNRVEMRRWRDTLGQIVPDGNEAVSLQEREEPAAWRAAARLARHVERAARRLPFETKCLPRAIALQWMLRRRRIGSRLVIARVRSDALHLMQDSKDEWHAWVERDGDMLIGHCDRSIYRPLLSIISLTPCPAQVAE